MRDLAANFIVFGLCVRCHHRLLRLPVGTRLKLATAALRYVAEHDEQVNFRIFASDIEARLFARLEADRLAGRI